MFCLGLDLGKRSSCQQPQMMMAMMILMMINDDDDDDVDDDDDDDDDDPILVWNITFESISPRIRLFNRENCRSFGNLANSKNTSQTNQ